MREERFSAVPVITGILKVMAVLVLLFFILFSVQNIITAVVGWRGSATPYESMPPVTHFGPRLLSLIGPIFYLVLGVLFSALVWGFADLFAMVRAMTLRKCAAALPEKE